MKLFRLLATILAFAAFCSVSAAEPPRFEPAVSTLTGRVMGEYVMVPGREMSKGVALLLDPAITIEGNPDSRSNRRAMRNVRKILLEPASDDLDLWSIAGETVTLEGVLFREHVDIFHSDVTMRVHKVIADQSGDETSGA